MMENNRGLILTKQIMKQGKNGEYEPAKMKKKKTKNKKKKKINAKENFREEKKRKKKGRNMATDVACEWAGAVIKKANQAFGQAQ